MNLKSFLKVFVIAGVIIAGLVYAFLPKPVAVDLDQALLRDMTVLVSEDGRTRVRQRYTIYSPLSGRLLRLPWQPGDDVEEGQTILARIVPLAPNLLDTRAKAESSARVKSAQAERERRHAELDRAIRAKRFAYQQKERKQELFRQRFTSREDLDSAILQDNLKAAELQAAREAVQVANFELEIAKAAKLTEGREGVTGEAFELPAAISGKILRVKRESGGFVRAGEPLLEIADPTNLEIVVDMRSTEAVKVHQGAPAYLDHWGGDRRLSARVRLVEPSGFTKISALGVEEQRVNVILDVTSPTEEWSALGDGFRAEVHIEIWRGQDILSIPNAALFWQHNRWNVFKVDAGRARLTPIDIGRRNDTFTMVTNGLTEGDQVVIHPGDQIKDHLKVTNRD